MENIIVGAAVKINFFVCDIKIGTSYWYLLLIIVTF